MNEEKVYHVTRSTLSINEWSKQLLSNLGINDAWVNVINVLVMLLMLSLLAFFVHWLTLFIVRNVFNRLSKLPKMLFLKHLNNRKFPHYLSMIVPFSLVKGSIPIIFESFPKVALLADKMADIYFIFYVIWLIMSIVNAFGDSLRTRPGLSDKPIDSYIQVVKIFLNFIGFVILFSVLTDKNPMYFITGLGALSAVLLLVFKDTIMGFVASIQVSTNDMVRIGDWITLPKYNADGDVVQITLTTVKIRNFDKTITTIPPYSLISESFQNWRGMQDSGGRRLKRSVFIKPSGIRFLKSEELEKLKGIQLIETYIKERQQDIEQYNQHVRADKSQEINGRNLTNMGLYRKYVESYLSQHPGVHKNMLLLVRQLQPTSQGLPLELYFFTNTIVWAEYENIVSDIFDHITAAVRYFDLEIFEDISSTLKVEQTIQS